MGSQKGLAPTISQQWLPRAAEDIARKALSTGVKGSDDPGKATQETAQARAPAAAVILNRAGQLRRMLAVVSVCTCFTASAQISDVVKGCICLLISRDIQLTSYGSCIIHWQTIENLWHTTACCGVS